LYIHLRRTEPHEFAAAVDPLVVVAMAAGNRHTRSRHVSLAQGSCDSCSLLCCYPSLPDEHDVIIIDISGPVDCRSVRQLRFPKLSRVQYSVWGLTCTFCDIVSTFFAPVPTIGAQPSSIACACRMKVLPPAKGAVPGPTTANSTLGFLERTGSARCISPQ
jgi:hypothetical protein